MNKKLMGKKHKSMEGFLWLLPFLIPYLIFTFAMLIMTFLISFTDYKILGAKVFNGLDNYEILFSDVIFWQALGNTLIFVLISTPILIITPLLFGILIENKHLSIRGFYRVTFFAPYVLPVSIVAFTFLYLAQPYTGLINNLLKTLGLLGADQELFWLMNARLAWVMIICETLWWTGGFNMMLYIAGMQEIPEQYYESAQLDGANYLQQTWYITLPLLSRVHMVVLFLQLVASFKVFGQVFLLTNGDPGGATRTYIQYLYENGFRTFKIGRASAASMILFVIILIVSIIQFTVISRFNQEEG